MRRPAALTCTMLDLAVSRFKVSLQISNAERQKDVLSRL
jgi:hypothetical protein